MNASYWRGLENGKVQCELCPNRCIIAEGASGVCRIRSNLGGTLIADAYGMVISLAIDPIEKKPLYHFHPSRRIVSTGPNGCNFRCGFCQNSEISQKQAPAYPVSPEQLAEAASDGGSIGVAYTYTEPFVWFEYIRDAGRLVRDRGLVNVLVSNGYVNTEPLDELLPLIDAMNIDIKSIRPDFYKTVCGGDLSHVQRTIATAAGRCHLELTNLVIPGYNDTDEDFHLLAEWVASVNPSIPLHFSRYFPRYEFHSPETPVATLERAYAIAREKLRYVYLGNVDHPGKSDTMCPKCGAVIITRSFYATTISGVRDHACARCGETVEVIGI